MSRLPRSRSIDLTSLSLRRLTGRRRSRIRRLSLEGLESRALLSNVSWINASGGDWDTASNWSDDLVPGPNDNVTISLSSTETITHSLSNSDSVLSLTTNGSTVLKITNGSLSLGAGSSTLAGPVTVSSGATLSVVAGASVLVESAVSDAGAVTFSSGDQVSVYNSQVSVSGSLTASGTDFINDGGAPSIAFASSATLGGGGNTYGLPIDVPYTLVPSLAGNASFDQVYIAAGTISSGTLAPEPDRQQLEHEL